ncbi:protein ROOT INITIATION DEFECTIVE 3-like [Oryza brachyantha]|uniref:protein ROOT INITIATION DEFECTIVE 3-like n=1 Tax=Oryza brachyantha TaxID=4533 RepID=UPI001ADC733B|nr:protein ROOT INITIATION DEFECTIVE 3-like [Oryza brachyantha]
MGGEKEAVLAVCASDAGGVVYDINTGEKIVCIQDCVAPPHGLAFVDGFLLAASRTDKDQPIFGSAIYFWAPSKIKEVQKSYVAEAIEPIACSKDGVFLVGGARSGHAYIWEIASGALLKRWRGHKTAISCLAFSQDTSLLISGSIDGTVCTWSMISLFQAEEPRPIEGTEIYLNFYNVKQNEHKASITGILTLLRSPCPILITSSLDGNCKVTELMSGILVQTISLSSSVTTIAVDPLEQFLLCGAGDAGIYVTVLNEIGTKNSRLTLSEDNCQILSGHRAPISALAFSSEGPRLVSGSQDRVILIWDTRTWQVIRKIENKMGGHITNLLVIPKGAISTVHQGRNSLAVKFPKLDKICKPTNETMTFLRPSQFSDNPVSFQSSNLLAEQILDLEEKRTPEAVEMIIAMNTRDKVKNQTIAKELVNMNMLVQGQVFDVMDAGADED